MKAIAIERPGGPGVLRVIERPAPVPQDGEVTIAVRAAGISRADALQRAGKYPPPPGASDIPGLEVAGTIDAIGSGVRDLREGDRVCALLSGGGYAEIASVAREQVLPIPRGWNFVEAATLPENAFTVYDNLFTRAKLQRGERLLVHGGTSGIGTTAIMFARALGASFIAATAGSPAKCDACRALGADLAIDYKSQDFVAAIREATQGRGVDVILDIVGGDYIARDLEALALDGRIVCISTQGGASAAVPLGVLLSRRASLMGSSLRARSVREKGEIADALLENVWPLLPARDPVRPVVDTTFPLDRAAEAHRRLEESAHIGKIVLVT